MVKMSPSHNNTFSPEKISSPSLNSKRPLLNTDNEDSSNENDNISSKRKKSCSLSQEDINEAVQTTTNGYMTRHRLLKQLKENNKLETSQDSQIPSKNTATKPKRTSRKKNTNFQKNKNVIPGYVFTNDIVSSPLNFKRLKTKKKHKNSVPSLFESGSESEKEELQFIQTSATTSNMVDKTNESVLVSDCASTFTKGGMKKYFNKKSTSKCKETINHNIQMGKSNQLSGVDDIDVSTCQKKNPAQLFRLLIGDDPSLKSIHLDDTSNLNSNSSECPGDSPQYLLVNNVAAKEKQNTIKSPQVNINNESSYSTSLQKSIFDLPLTPASVIESLGSDDGSNQSMNSQFTNGSNLEMLNSFLINSQQTNKDGYQIENTPVTPINFDFSGFVATELPQTIIKEQTNDADNKLNSSSILASLTATNTNVIINSCIKEKLQSSLPIETKCNCKTYFDLDITRNTILNTKSNHFVFDINTQKARDKFHHQKLGENNALQSLITKGKESLIRPRNNIVDIGNILKVKPVPKYTNDTLEVVPKTSKKDHTEPVMTILKKVSNETVIPNNIKDDSIEHITINNSNKTSEVAPKTSRKDPIEPVMPILKNVSNEMVIPNNIKDDCIEHNTSINNSNKVSQVVPKTSRKDPIQPVMTILKNVSIETVIPNNIKDDRIEHISINNSNKASEVVPKTSKISCFIQPIINSITNEIFVANVRKESHVEHNIKIGNSNETQGVPKTYHIEPDIMSILNEAYVGVDYHSDSCEFLNEIFSENVNDVETIKTTVEELDTLLPTKTAESKIKNENTNGHQLNPECRNSKTIVQKNEHLFENASEKYSPSKSPKNNSQIILKSNFKVEKKELIKTNHVNGKLNKTPKSSTLTFGNIFNKNSPVKYENDNTKNQSSWSLKNDLVSKEELNIAGQIEVKPKRTHLNENYMRSKSITSPNKLFLESATKDEPRKSPMYLNSQQFNCGNSALKSKIEQTKTTSYINNEWFSDSETSSDSASTQTILNNVVPVSTCNGKNINLDNSTITTANDENNSMASKSITSPNRLFLESASKDETNKSLIHPNSNRFHCDSSPLKSVIEESTKTMSCINDEWFSDSGASFDEEPTETTSNNVVPVSICNGKNINSDNSTITTANDENNSMDWQVSSNELFNSKTNTLSPNSRQIIKDKKTCLKSHSDTLGSEESKKLSNNHTSCVTKLKDGILELPKDTLTPLSESEQINKNDSTRHNKERKSLFGFIQNNLPSLESHFEHNTLTKSMDQVHCEQNTMEIDTVDIPQPSIFNLNLNNSSPAIVNSHCDDGKVLIRNNNSTDNDSSDDEGKLQIECDFDNYSDKNSRSLDPLQKFGNNVLLNSSNDLSLCGNNSISSEDVKKIEPQNTIPVFNQENGLVTNLNDAQENDNELYSLNNFDTNDKDTALPTAIVEPKEDHQSSTRVQLDYMSPNLTVDMCNELFLKEYSNDTSSFPKHIQDIFTEMLVDVPYVPMCIHMTIPECDDLKFTSDSITNTKTHDININDMPVEISNVDMKSDDLEFTSDSIITNTKTHDININDMPVEISNVDTKADVSESMEKFNESGETSCEVKTPKRKKKKKKKKKNTALQKKPTNPKSNMKIRCNLREFINSEKSINEVVESKEFRNLRFFSEDVIACSFGVFLYENTLDTPVINGLEPYKVDYSQLDDAKKFEHLRNTNLHINCPKIVRLTLLTLALAKMIRKDSLIHNILNVIRKNLLNKKLNTNHQKDDTIITQTTYFVDICVRLRLLKTLQMFIFDSMVILPNKYCCVIFISLLMWKTCLPRKLNDQQDPVLVPILSCLIAKQKFYSEQYFGPDIYQRELINLLSLHFNYSFSTELPVDFMQHINKPDFFVSIVLFLKCCNPKDKIEFIVNCLFPIIENYLNTQQNEGNALKTMRALVISIPPFKTSCNTIVASYVNKYKRLVYPSKDSKEHINITMYNCYKTLQEKFLSYFNDNRNRSRLFEESLATMIMVLASVDYATSTVALMKWKPKYKLSELLLKKIAIFKSVLGSELWDKLCDMDDSNMVNCIINSSLLKNKNVDKVITQVHAIQ